MENKFFYRLWVHNSMRDFHVTLGVLAIAARVVGQLSKHPELYAVADILAIFTILHYFIHGYFYRQQIFLTDNQKVYSLPKKKIAKTGGFFLCGFVIAVSVGMAVVKEIYSGTLFMKLKAMLLYVLGIIFEKILGTDGLGTDQLLLQDNTDLLGVMNQFSPKAETAWDRAMNMIQTLLVVIGVIFLIIVCVVMIVNYFRRLLGKAGFEVKGGKGLDVKDREEKLRERSLKKESIFDFSPNAKARRIYRRCINKQRKRGQAVPEWMTPSEIEMMVEFSGDSQHLELHKIYEKARYSESGCTEEDAKRAKSLKL